MPHNHEWQTRIKSVEREYISIRQAANWFSQAATNDPSILLDNVKHAEIIEASDNLESTYFLRLFAEFESGSRNFWKSIRGSEPKTADLLNGLAAKCKISEADRVDAHLVRDYRNCLVHEREGNPEGLGISLARGCLCRFCSFLPSEW